MNRFDLPYGSRNNYVSTVAPMPLQALTDLAQTHSNRYRSALDDINNTKGLLKVNADPRNVKFRDQYMNTVNSKLTDLSERITKQGYTPELQNEWYRTKNTIVSDPDRLALENAYGNYQAYQKDKIANSDKSVYDEIYNDYTGQGDPNKVTPYNYQGMRVKQDYIPVMDKSIDGLKADSKAWEGYRKDKSGKPIINEFGQLTKTDGSKEELSGNKLKEIAGIVAPTFFQSKESQYFIDEAFGRPMPSYNELPKEAQDALLTKATQDIIRRGSTQLFSKADSGIDLQNLSEHALNREDANNTTSTQSEAMLNNNIVPTLDMKFDSGKLIPATKAAFSKSTNVTDDFGKPIPGAKEDLNKGTTIDTQAYVEQLNKIKQLKTDHPSLKELNDEQTVKAYNNAVKSLNAESIPLESISNVAAKNIGDAIARNKAQRNFYLWDSKGKTVDGTFTTVLEELDIKEADFDKALQNGIGGYTQAGPNAGSYYVEVKDGDDKTRRVMISPDAEMQKMFRASQAVNDARKSLNKSIVTPIPEIPNYKILVKPEIQKDGNIKWEYGEVITDEQGNMVKSNPTTLDAIRKSEREHLKRSGYLGSNVGVLKNNTTQ